MSSLSAPRRPGVVLQLSILVLIVTVLLATTATAQAKRQTDPRLRDARRAVLAGRVQEALALLTALEDEHPNWSEVALWHGHALRRSGNRGAAARQYFQALRLDPTSAGALIALGDMQANAGNLVRARDYYTRAVAAAPEFPLGYRKAAGMEVQLMLHGDAIAHLHQYLALRPGDVVAIGILGMEQYLDENIDAAVATYERALKLEPDATQIHFGLGMALADRPTEQERALTHLRAALEADPDNAMALYLIGRIQASRGALEAALAALDASLVLESEQPDAHYRIALVYARMGDRESARAHQARFQQLSQARDQNEELQRRIGLLKEAAGVAMAANDLERVRRTAVELAALAPDDADVLMVMARVALTSGDSAAALQATGKALALYPEHWEALYLRGLLMYRADRLAQARDLLERSTASDPLYAPGQAALGNVRMALGDERGALGAYESAVMLEPENPAHYLNLAAVYAALGESELAARAQATYRRLSVEQ